MEEEKDYKIYCHTNLINNKKYVGQTSLDAKERWNNGNGYRYNKHFYSSIKKYGWKNFKHEILHDNLTKQDADYLEKYYIKEWDLMNPEKGYNLREGGSDGKMSKKSKEKMSKSRKGKHISDEVKQKISIANKGIKKTEEAKAKMKIAKIGKYNGENNPFYGKKHSKETKEKMSKSRKGKYCGEKHPCYGRKLTQEQKNKISERNKKIYIGNNNPNAKKCICIETNEIFNTLKEASIKLNLTIAGISNVCNGRQKTTGGFSFKYI